MKTQLFLIFIISSITLYSQNFFIEWKQCFGGDGFDSPNHIITTNTGTMICAHTTSDDGSATNFHAGECSDAWVISLDTFGNVLWEKCYGGTAIDNGDFILKAVDEDAYYIIGKCGSNDGDITHNPYPGVGSIMIIKIDPQGNIIWNKIFGNGYTFPYLLYATSTYDGGLIIGAQITSSGGDVSEYFGSYDVWLLKVNSNGDKEWDKTLGSETDQEFINNITPLEEGGYLIGMYGDPQGAGIGNINCVTFPSCKSDIIIVKLDKFGKKLWERCMGGTDNDLVVDIIVLDSSYLLAGAAGSGDGDVEGTGYHGEKDIWIIEIDIDGNIIWSKCYGGTKTEYPSRIFINQEKEIYVVGQTNSNNYDVSGIHHGGPYSISKDIWVSKIGQDHEIIFQKCLGNNFDENVLWGATFNGTNKLTIAAQFVVGGGEIDCEHQSIINGEGNYDIWAISVLDTTVNNTAIEEFEYGLEIYPNPANHQLTIKIPENTNFQSVSNTSENNILLFNNLGELAGEFPIKKQITINTTGFPSGLYFLQCAIGDALITDKVMILHE